MARNKPHSQKHASKRSAKKQGGRQAAKASAPATKFARANAHKGGNAAGTKRKETQAAIARRKNKMAQVSKEKAIGTPNGPPRIVGVVPLNESANVVALTTALRKHCGDSGPPPETPSTIWDRTLRLRMTLVVEPDGNEQNVLDVAKVADILLLVLDCSAAVQSTLKNAHVEALAEDFASTYFGDIGLCITDMTRELVQVLNCQGSPTPVVVLDGLSTFDDPRRRASCLRIHQRYFQSVMCQELIVLSSDDVGTIARSLSEAKLRPLHWRDQRPYTIVEHASYDEAAQELTFSGYLRGANLSANQLIHITNHGTYQIRQITVVEDPCKWKETGAAHEEIVDVPTADKQESLQETQLNDTYEDDQAWVMKNIDPPMVKRKVPAGVSEYQAAWYDGEDGAVDDPASPDANQVADDEDAETYRTNATDANFLTAADVLRHERLTDEERAAELQRLRDESADEVRHPDEVDTPFALPARHRFSKYRGLKSFNSSPWDPNENLPPDYARIFKLQGYSKVRESVLREADDAPTNVGDYVEVVLCNVPPAVWDTAQNNIIVSAQLKHEQKWSVLHFQVRRSLEFDEPIKSKTLMLAHVGFRKMYVQPLFSDVVPGDRTKYSRYFHAQETFRLATFFGPISFHPCPIVLFQATSQEEEAEGVPMRLACYGSAVPPNPDLLLIKRTVLTGRIATIFRRSLIVKYMFFNDEDVRWFQPVDLYTRLGRRGKISKPIGTHGLFRAVFNEQVMQHDVVCMDLYKRVYPKWTTVMYNVAEVLDGAFGAPSARKATGARVDDDDDEEAAESGDDDEWEDVDDDEPSPE